MRLKEELIGVIAYSYPPLAVNGRNKAVGYKPDHVEINEEWAVISRVIIHPKYRSIGLGAHLIRETLGMQGCRHVELVAVMARYNPFAEKAGMKPIQVSEPDPSVVQTIDMLSELGFSPVYLSS